MKHKNVKGKIYVRRKLLFRVFRNVLLSFFCKGRLLVSYLALQKQLEGKTVEKIDGFTPAQRFFIGYARVWGQNITPEEEIRLTKIDPHSLGINRVNQALKNIDAFYEAFNVQPGDPMYIAPEERVVVW